MKKIETKCKEKINLYFKALKSLMTKQKTSLFDIPGTNHKFYQNKSLGKGQKISLKSMKDMGYSPKVQITKESVNKIQHVNKE